MIGKAGVYSLQQLNFLHNSSAKVGILGGSFDPPHAGHLSLSVQAINYYHFDFIIWLVAKQNPLKPQYKNDIFSRANSASLLARNNPQIIVSTAEYGLNYTYIYYSLKHIINRFKNCSFTWLMGIDNIADFNKWHRSKDIIELCNIIIFDRPCKTRMLNCKAVLAKSKTRNIIIHRGVLRDISSTYIRLNF